MAYASGKFARALCDRCAFEYPLHSLKEEWNGLKTCPECFETKHPQLEPHTAPADPQALYKPRPNTDKEVGEGLFGISFKMKGPRGKIKTTINPIRTLTPRFIQKIIDQKKETK